MRFVLRLVAVVMVLLATWLLVARSGSGPADAAMHAPVPVREAGDTGSIAGARAAADGGESSSVAARVIAPTAPTEPAGSPTPGAALVRVHVVARETRRPLATCRLVAHRRDAKSWVAVDVDGSHGGMSQSIGTDAGGRAEIEVESGCELQLDVSDGRGNRVPVEIPALAAGEQRDILVDIPTEADLLLCGRLVEDETGQLIGNGVVRADEPEPIRHVAAGVARAGDDSNIHTRSDGSFELRARSWEESFAIATAGGYARVVFALEPGHDTPDRALVVRMRRAAILEVLVLERGSAVPNATVELTTSSYQLQQNTNSLHFYFKDDPRWSKSTDANGRAGLGDLPPHVPLTLSVTAPGRQPRVDAEPVTLDPGEHRSLTIAVGSGASIVGRIEDTAGRPVSRVEVWRVTAELSMPKLLESYEKPVATVVADEQGRFRFDDVATGLWHVGPRPMEGGDGQAADAIPALAQLVQIDASSREVAIVVRVDRGLYMKGRVLDPSGAPAIDCDVSAHADSAWVYVHAQTDASGRFVLGPLPAGSYTLEGGGFGHGNHAKSESVQAVAGDSAVELHLRSGGGIRGRVVDATGKQRECELILAAEGEKSFIMSGTRDGTIHFAGLLPDTYTVSATTGDGQCARRTGLLVRGGETIDGVEIVLLPGGRLRVLYDGPERSSSYEVVVGGTTFATDGIERGKTVTVIVPTGEIEIRWSAGDGGAVRSQRLTLAVGEERTVKWTGKS
jgi:hypothetical protein